MPAQDVYTISMTVPHSELQHIVSALQKSGLTVETMEDGALVQQGSSQVVLFAEPDGRGGVIVRMHLDLDLYVEEESLPDILMGINLMNQDLDYGALNLDPIESDEDEDSTLPLTFSVLGRTVLWLPDLGAAELDRLQEHLRRFEAEVTDTVEQTLHGPKGLSA